MSTKLGEKLDFGLKIAKNVLNNTKILLTTLLINTQIKK